MRRRRGGETGSPSEGERGPRGPRPAAGDRDTQPRGASPASPSASPFSLHSIRIIISSILSQEKQTSPSFPSTRRGGEGVAGPDNKAAGVERSCKEIIDM